MTDSLIQTKKLCKCTFCGEAIPAGDQCYRWTGFNEGIITGTESAHPECWKGKELFDCWRRGEFVRGSLFRKEDLGAVPT